ncbi:MAG TPA: family 16 glycoside hydrolase [Actinophytocola sp.]|uniref:pectate lyase family protein n=1 Tax=Actinophytocola sp. TaxID=1872138 RepID=UPI002DBC6884|nr:family 16 glycoside hydrolase [Actinophytocola sp.]HEU5470444.1 family 16 glycoside hydrolase [Actinophytocola sp.]
MPPTASAGKFGRRFWSVAAPLVAVSAMVFALVSVSNAPTARADTLLSDNFEDGNLDGWTRSGGSWSVTADGSQVARQSSTSSDARALAGQSTWANYAVQARVKALSFNGSDRFAAVLARAQSNTSYYYLTLRSSNTVQLRKLVSGSATTLATANIAVTTGTFYTLRLEVNGSTLRGFVNGTQVGQATDTQFGSGRAGVATFNASASFDDVLVETVGGPPGSTTLPVPTTTTSPGPPPPPGPLVGWATQGGGTTGGTGGTTVDVDTESEFLAVVETATRQTIRVTGTIAIDGMVEVGSNKTIIGVGANSGFTGGGLTLEEGSSNVIIRNLNFRGSDDDGVNVEEGAHHVWIDHNAISGTSDGTIDIKRGADFITVSWNHTFGQTKDMLLGHDDDNGGQDRGHLRVTYHHNWYDGTAERHPRVRFGNPVHVYNNYVANADYGVASTVEAGVLVENNYYENVVRPLAVGVFESPGGNLVHRGNVFVNSGAPESAGSVNPIPYGYTLDPGANVKSLVLAGAGPGRI